MSETELAGALDVGFHPLLGIDDRAVSKGVQRNDSFNNINAFSDVLRQRDSAYYDEMPFNTIDTDPSNTNKNTQDLSNLRAVLQERVNSLRTSEAVVEEADAPVATHNKSAPKGLAGVLYDITSWNTLPASSTWGKIRYVATREGRLPWIIFFIVMLMIIGYAIHIWKK